MEGKLERISEQPVNGQPVNGQPANGQPETPVARGPVAPAAPALTEFVLDDVVYSTLLTRKFRQRKAWRPIDPHLVIAAIPGQILQLNVKIGDRVTRGQSLLVLEAMKMQNQILSPLAGRVVAISVQVGQKVAKGELMLELKD